MKKLLNSLLIASALLLGACGNHNNDSKDVAKDQNDQKFDSTNIEDDTKFAVNAADGGMLEVELGKLALTNGSAQVVKDFGQQMVTDHSKGGEELKGLAQKKNISLPAALSDDKQKKVNDMSQKKGADFDKAYMDMMVDDHNEDIEEFRKETDKGNDADIKAWASTTLPMLEHHLEMAKAGKDQVHK